MVAVTSCDPDGRDLILRITDAFPAPGATRPPAQPFGSSRPVRSTGRAELSGFGNAIYVI